MKSCKVGWLKNRMTFAAMIAAFAMSALNARAETTADYVHDGLVACWDGYENAGYMQHDADATVWKDLVNGIEITLPSWVTVEENAMLSAADKSKTSVKLASIQGADDAAAITVEQVIQRVEWTYTDDYNNLQNVFNTPRGTIGYRQNKSKGFYYYGPKSSTQNSLQNWVHATALVSDLHTVSGVFGSNLATDAIYMDAVKDTVTFNANYSANRGTQYSFFGNLRAKMRVCSIRVYNRVLTDSEIADNRAVDVKRFVNGDLSSTAGRLIVVGEPQSYAADGSPAYGETTGHTNGENVTLTAPSAVTNGDFIATCKGWIRYEFDLERGKLVPVATNSAANKLDASFTFGSTSAKVEWQWTISHLNATTRTWTGGTNTKIGNVNYMLASTASNWAEGEVPIDGDHIVFDSTGAANACRWDLDVCPGSWTQTTGYVNTVTFTTTYGDSFPFFEVAGNVTLNGGTWTHLANGGLNRTYRLYVKVGGDMTLGPDAKITAYALGYQNQYMARGGTFSGTKIYATHGGWGYENTAVFPLGGNGAVPYGKVSAPEEPGSGNGGSTALGGGAIRLDVTGALVADGAIDADALIHKNYMGAGGSVYIRAGTISGSGTITADSMTQSGGNACGSGSGGRVAIVLTGANASFTNFNPEQQCSAVSGTLGLGSALGQPGTIYAETPQDEPGEGWLIIKSSSTASKNTYCNMTPIAGYNDGPVKYSRITMVNANAAVCIPDYATVDMSEMASGTMSGKVILAGGNWKPPFDGAVSYPVESRDGLVGIDSPRLDIVSGGSLTVRTAATDAYDGDLSVASGCTVTLSAPLRVLGDLSVTGKISRTESAAPATPVPIEVEVGGNLTIDSAGSISAADLGYAGKKCPMDQTFSGASGSHGGWGWATASAASAPSGVEPYGSVKNPETAGSGGGNQERGGGIVKITAGGILANDGLITAASKSVGYYAGAGGSVNIRAAGLTGNGIITAASGWQNYVTGNWAVSAGGRVAIQLTGANADFSAYTGVIRAFGGRKESPAANQYVGSAGTIWLKTASESGGNLIVDNGFPGLLYYCGTLLGGAYMAADELSYDDVLVGRSAKLMLQDGKTLEVSGVFSNGCQFVAGTGSTVAFTGSDLGAVYGNVTFENISCQTPGKEIRIAAGATVTVSGSAAFTGTAADPIVMKSTVDGQSWNLTGSAIAMNGVALKDCNSSSPFTVLNGVDLGGNSANITFVGAVQGEELTWLGTDGSSWSTASNWDANRVPIAEDDITIPAGCPNMPSLGSDVTVASLSVESGASLSLCGMPLTVNGNANIAGALIASADEVISVNGNLSLTGTFEAAGSTVVLTGDESRTLTVGNGVVFNVLDMGVGAVSVTGDIKAEALTIGDDSSPFSVTFADGANVDVNLFTAKGDGNAVNGILTVSGNSGVWNLSASVPDVSGVAVTGSDASGGVLIVTDNCTDNGRNVNWLFTDTRTHWTGAVSSDFADADNWTDGVPTSSKDAVIEGTVACVVSEPAEVRNLTVAVNAVLRVNSADFAVCGSLTIDGSGTVEWNMPGTIAGRLVMLDNSVLTHGVNSASITNKINLTVGGAGYIAAGAKVDAFAKQTVLTVAGTGASHGGRSGWRPGYGNDTAPNGVCYGSILHPESVGGVGSSNAGGAVRLTFGGQLRLDGEIDADASVPSGAHYGSAGGSIWLTAPSIDGTGSIHANGGIQSGIDAGGGGRVAIFLTQATALGVSDVHVYGGRTDENYAKGSAGTYYLETASDAPGYGILTVANVEGKVDTAHRHGFATDLPSVAGGGKADEARHVNLVVKHYGTLFVTQDTSVGSLVMQDSTARIKLNGHKLRVHTRRPKNWNDSLVDYGEGGEILWSIPGTFLMLR